MSTSPSLTQPPSSSSDLAQKSLALHRAHQGKIAISATVPVATREDLSLAYTPGVAEPSRVIAQNAAESFNLTWRGRVVAVISDGSAVLGLGNIGPEAAMPVMEGKALLMKSFANVDAVPIVINTQDTQEIITFVKQIAPSFAGINLEDIAAPRCFEVENALQEIGIPVFHDDQHGTAIVVLAALINAAKVVNKPFSELKVVILGAGAAGLTIAKMLLGVECNDDECVYIDGANRVGDVVLVDRQGALSASRTDLNAYKKQLVSLTNKSNLTGSLTEAIKGADVFIGVSGPNLVTAGMIQSMNRDAIVFAMANPTPEIMPEAARAAGARVVATGRSDFANQINNVLAFPAIFRAIIDGRLTRVTSEMQYRAAMALAEMVKNSSEENIIPDPFTPNLAKDVAKKILNTL